MSRIWAKPVIQAVSANVRSTTFSMISNFYNILIRYRSKFGRKQTFTPFLCFTWQISAFVPKGDFFLVFLSFVGVEFTFIFVFSAFDFV